MTLVESMAAVIVIEPQLFIILAYLLRLWLPIQIALILASPDLATSATSTPCSLAMNPRKEKMTVPAKMEVQELTLQTIRASL